MDALNGSEIAALAARLDELSQACARLSQENADLRLAVAQLKSGPGVAAGVVLASAGGSSSTAGRPGRRAGSGDGTAGARDGKVSRRMMGKALGAAAAGVVGAVALAEASAGPAAAADGDAIKAGNSVAAEAATTLGYDGTAGPGIIFLAQDLNFAPSAAEFPAALGGWGGKRVGNGVYGFTNASGGNGVVGVIVSNSKSGNGVHGVASDPGTTGVLGENSSNKSNAVAVAGLITAKDAGGFSVGVMGHNSGTGGNGIGVQGSQDGNGWGVYGTSNGGLGVNGSSFGGGNGIGVSGAGDNTGVNAFGNITGLFASGPTAIVAKGSAKAPGLGVDATGTTAVQAVGTTRGVSASGPTGVRGIGTATGGIGVRGRGDAVGSRGGVFSGTAAQAQLVPGALASHPRSGSRGDLYADKTGRLWFCKKTGNPAL